MAGTAEFGPYGKTILSDLSGNYAGIGQKLDGNGLTKVTVNISTATTTTVVALTAAQSIRVYRMLLNFAAPQTMDIRSSVAGSLIGAAMTFGTGGWLVLDFDGEPWFVTTAGEALTFVTTTTGLVTGTVYYVKAV